MAAEVIGASLATIVQGCGAFQSKVRSLLKERGITEIDHDAWYKLEDVASVLNELERTVGPNLMVLLGRYIPENAMLPPEIDTFEKALLSLDMVYQMHHRNGEVGSYNITVESPGQIRAICNTPAYSTNVNLGMFRGFGNKFGIAPNIEVVDPSGGGEFMIRY